MIGFPSAIRRFGEAAQAQRASDAQTMEARLAHLRDVLARLERSEITAEQAALALEARP